MAKKIRTGINVSGPVNSDGAITSQGQIEGEIVTATDAIIAPDHTGGETAVVANVVLSNVPILESTLDPTDLPEGTLFIHYIDSIT